MPFNAALTGGQITQVRQTTQAFEHYLLVNPNDIVWQADVDDTKTAVNYAEFEWTNTLDGDPDDVIAGMVVLITTSTSDFSNPVIRGRVRKVPGATTFYINETGTDIDDTMYLTVIDDFDIMERLARVTADGTRYKDWDITWQDLPTIIAGLQSVYVDFSGSDPVTMAFTPTATATADGAAISSWLWDVGDGTITVGTAASQNITVEFPDYTTNEHRWVHLTVTDDNGNATAFHFEVYTVHKQTSTAVKLNTGELQITGTIEDGWNATITGWDGLALSEVLDRTRVTIAGIDHYSTTTTPVVSNILMVGRLRAENNRTVADEQASAIPDTVFTIEGFATTLAGLPAPAMSIIDDAAPAAWGEITDPDPYRAVVFFLAFHTTYPTLSSISSDDLSDYVLGDFSLGETTALDNVNKQLDSANGIAAFAPAGETTLRRKASYLSDADRAGLTTVFDFTTADITPDLAMDYQYGETVGEIEAGAVVYNTTSDDIDYRYIGRAPASSFGSGHETAQLNGQVLIANSSDTDARAELIQRTADHLAYINPKVRLNVGLMDGFHFIIPTLHQRWTFTLTATDTARGRTYTSADYWQLLDVSYSADNEANTRELTATFEEETQGENAGISVTLVPDVNALDYSLPPLSPYDTFPDDGLTNFPVDDPDIDPYFSGGMSSVLEPAPGNLDAPANCETLNIPMYGEFSRGTTRNTVFGETYTIRIEGVTAITGGCGDWLHVFDFASSDGSWAVYDIASSAGSQEIGEWTNGTGWTETNIVYADTACGVAITRTLSQRTINQITIHYKAVESVNNTTGNAIRVQLWDGPLNILAWDFDSSGTTGGLWTADDTIDVDCGAQASQTIAISGLSFNLDHTKDVSDGITEVYSVEVCGDGSDPWGGGGAPAGSSYGDAFYEWDLGGSAQLYGAGLGFLINAAKPGTIGPYQENHDYTVTATGTGAPFSFKYKLTNYTGADRNVLRITVCGPNMGVTT